MSSRVITPHIPATTVYGNRQIEKKAYTNWRPRGSGDWLLIYTEKGSGLIAAAERKIQTQEGDLLLYEPLTPQDYSTHPDAGRWHLLWAHFQIRPAWISWLDWPLPAPGIRLVNIPESDRPAFVGAMERMIRYCRRTFHHLAMNALEEAVLWGHESAAAAQGPLLDPRVRKARQILMDEFPLPFSLGKLAKRCGLSVSRLSHLFQRTGQSPQQFLEHQRLAHARQLLLRTNLSIEQIAGECGYEDPFYFSKRFSRSQGLSPRAFRESALDPAAPSAETPRTSRRRGRRQAGSGLKRQG